MQYVIDYIFKTNVDLNTYIKYNRMCVQFWVYHADQQEKNEQNKKS